MLFHAAKRGLYVEMKEGKAKLPQLADKFAYYAS